MVLSVKRKTRRSKADERFPLHPELLRCHIEEMLEQHNSVAEAVATIEAELKRTWILEFSHCCCMHAPLQSVRRPCSYFVGAQMLLSCPDRRAQATGLWALGHCLPSPLPSPWEVLLSDGRRLNEAELYKAALLRDNQCAYAYNSLGVLCDKGRWVPTIDMTIGIAATPTCGLDWYREALRCDPTCPPANYNFLLARAGVLCSDVEPTRQSLCRAALRGDHTCSPAYALLCSEIDPASPWSRTAHVGSNTNILFATLLLGVQRLEDTETLPLAHQAMLEEMLTCWLWQDTLAIDPPSNRYKRYPHRDKLVGLAFTQ